MAFDHNVHNAVCSNSKCKRVQSIVRKTLIRRALLSCSYCGYPLDLPAQEKGRILRPFEGERPEKARRPTDILTPGQLRDKIDNRSARERLAINPPVESTEQSETERVPEIIHPPPPEPPKVKAAKPKAQNGPAEKTQAPDKSPPQSFSPRPHTETKLASGHMAEYMGHGACSNPLGNEEAALRFLRKRPGWWRVDDPKSMRVWFVPPETASFVVPESGIKYRRPEQKV